MDPVQAYFHSPIGWMRLEGSDAGLHSLVFINEELKEQIAQDIPVILKDSIHQLDEYFLGKRKAFELPLLTSGTDFETKVWNELSTIPYGQTVTYKWLAMRISDAKAVRAVAAANGRNKLAVIIPCHRVIGSNNHLTGYAGELWRKAWLLEHEGKGGKNYQGKLF